MSACPVRSGGIEEEVVCGKATFLSGLLQFFRRPAPTRARFPEANALMR
jgi:hypothetical protein